MLAGGESEGSGGEGAPILIWENQKDVKNHKNIRKFTKKLKNRKIN